MRLFGEIDGDPNCEDGETVRLRRSIRGGGFKTIATTATDNTGDYEFELVVRKTKKYKTVAPATTTPDACQKAISNTVTVNVNQ